MSVTTADRILGCLQGIATGDAIGKQAESLTHADVRRWYPHAIRGFEGAPGTVIPRYVGNSKREWRIGRYRIAVPANVRREQEPAQLRVELRARLPFETEIMICEGREIVRMMSANHFAGQPERPDVVRFVSVLSQRPPSAPPTPLSLPSAGKWLLKILAQDNRFVFGLYRRQMKAIGYLGTLDRIFGVPATTRNWNTIAAIAKVLAD